MNENFLIKNNKDQKVTQIPARETVFMNLFGLSLVIFVAKFEVVFAQLK